MAILWIVILFCTTVSYAAEPDQVKKTVCAIKTNLLYDAASLLNLGVEVPLGNRFSISLDAVFPWWRNRKNDITIQMLEGTAEGRFWFGNRAERERLTGFFAGIYAGGGLFDLQLGKITDGRGAQGEFFVMGGISAGYAHKIGKRLSLEYSLGVEYLQCEFREYIPVKGTHYGDIKAVEYPWELKRFSGVIPARASVSLVWVLFSNKRGGG